MLSVPFASSFCRFGPTLAAADADGAPDAAVDGAADGDVDAGAAAVQALNKSRAAQAMNAILRFTALTPPPGCRNAPTNGGCRSSAAGSPIGLLPLPREVIASVSFGCRLSTVHTEPKTDAWFEQRRS